MLSGWASGACNPVGAQSPAHSPSPVTILKSFTILKKEPSVFTLHWAPDILSLALHILFQFSYPSWRVDSGLRGLNVPSPTPFSDPAPLCRTREESEKHKLSHVTAWLKVMVPSLVKIQLNCPYLLGTVRGGGGAPRLCPCGGPPPNPPPPLPPQALAYPSLPVTLMLALKVTERV